MVIDVSAILVAKTILRTPIGDLDNKGTNIHCKDAIILFIVTLGCLRQVFFTRTKQISIVHQFVKI